MDSRTSFSGLFEKNIALCCNSYVSNVFLDQIAQRARCITRRHAPQLTLSLSRTSIHTYKTGALVRIWKKITHFLTVPVQFVFDVSYAGGQKTQPGDHSKPRQQPPLPTQVLSQICRSQVCGRATNLAPAPNGNGPAEARRSRTDEHAGTAKKPQQMDWLVTITHTPDFVPTKNILSLQNFNSKLYSFQELLSLGFIQQQQQSLFVPRNVYNR